MHHCIYASVSRGGGAWTVKRSLYGQLAVCICIWRCWLDNAWTWTVEYNRVLYILWYNVKPSSIGQRDSRTFYRINRWIADRTMQWKACCVFSRSDRVWWHYDEDRGLELHCDPDITRGTSKVWDSWHPCMQAQVGQLLLLNNTIFRQPNFSDTAILIFFSKSFRIYCVACTCHVG